MAKAIVYLGGKKPDGLRDTDFWYPCKTFQEQGPTAYVAATALLDRIAEKHGNDIAVRINAYSPQRELLIWAVGRRTPQFNVIIPTFRKNNNTGRMEFNGNVTFHGGNPTSVEDQPDID